LIRETLYELLVISPIIAGFYAATFEAMRDNATMKFGTLFSGWRCPYLLRLMGLTIIVSLLTRFLSLFFLIPGIYFALITAYAIPMQLQNQHIPLRACGAIKLSIITLSRYVCCNFFGFVIATGLLNLLGALCFGIGLFVTIPITLAAFCYSYHHLVGVNGMAVLVPAETAAAMHAAAAAAAQQPTVVVVQPAAQPQA